MPASRPHVVAIFGGNHVADDVSAVARAAGALVADERAVTMTGGDGTSTGHVKDEASRGARPGAWVAVLNTTDQERRATPVGTGLVVRPGLGHQRNLLEASLCDAAIVVQPGAGTGTLSELVGALCLGRPVLLVGEPERWAKGASEWRAVHRWFTTDELAGEAAEAIVGAALAQLTDPAGLLDDAVARRITVDRLRLGSGRAHAAGAGVEDEIRAWVRTRLDEPQGGAFPGREAFSVPNARTGEQLDDLKRDYDAWMGDRAPSTSH